ncbi:hypothetical protein EVJ58_g656 [Rhodofomes roseus]|uniref:Uncharacterized protein n=1 Tax=Rhodofomes roseus TaxID=34475 RepID=A0A4Y9Z4M7_9APHY|nr:hypothetical protein EVJ58_g656 [Rhodofomes roseus]
MANTATLNSSVDPSEVEAANDADTRSPSRASPDKGVFSVTLDLQSHEAASPMSLSPGSALSPLRGSPANGLPATQSSATASGVPHQKKFTHSNINKKFLEKTYSSSSGQTLSASVTAKTGSATPKPSLQTAVSHSRLVTAKLTATAQSSTTGPGWSRPPSSVSSATPASPSATNSKAPPPSSSTPNSSGSAPQPPPVGKVIQPQPRGATEIFVSSVKRDSSNKPAWSSARSATAVVNRLDAAANDFPTAAEVAQGRASKLAEQKEAAQAAAAQKEAMTAEADTFRGVHLDPNAHHWDEMEEDDDNFLDGVIDFGDGRQYKVEATEVLQIPPSAQDVPGSAKGNDDPAPPNEGLASLDQPVSKEERFAEDFDRSWPRSGLTTNFTSGQREQFSNGAPSPASSQSVHSPSESKVLFNERSNRLEPYSSVHPPHRQAGVSPSESRGGRDIPPHVHPQNVQLLQKAPGGVDRRYDGPRPTGEHVGHSAVPPRHSDRDFHRHDTQPPPSFTRTSAHGYQGRPNDHRGPYGMPPPAGQLDERPPRMSAMPPPPLPMHHTREPQRESSRQLPPHLSDMRSPQQRSRVSLVPDGHGHRRETSNLTAEPPPDTPRSPAVSVDDQVLTSLAVAPTESAPPSSEAPAVDLNEVYKKEMHTAAERARLRRQQEEEEREREKERARKKAAELEAQQKAKEEQKRPDAPEPSAISDNQVIVVIEDAVRSADASAGPVTPTPDVAPPSASKTPFNRPTSSKGSARPLQGRRMSSTAVTGQDQPSAAMEADSWRSRAPPRWTAHVEPAVATAALPPPPLPLLAEVESLHLKGGDDVEVVDFLDLGSSSLVHSRISPSQHRHHDDRLQSGTSHLPSGHHGHGPQRSPLTSSYREAPMSALNDAISRIKGALDDMHTKEEPPKLQKWVPPALRLTQGGHDLARPSEVFDVTGKEPPRSPKPAWNVFTVKLPKAASPQLPPVRTKQLHGFRSATSVSTAIYSWVPPISGSSRRDVAVDDYLFGSPTNRPSHTRYLVALPPRRYPVPSDSSGPVVNLPSKPSGAKGTKAVAREAESTSWRRPAPASTRPVQDAADVRPGLDTMSRSPPPEAPFGSIASLPKSEPTSPSRVVGAPAKSQAQSQNIVGSGVASHRDVKFDDAVQPASVSFVVSSELDVSIPAESMATRGTAPQVSFQSVSRVADVSSGRSEGKSLAEPFAITSSDSSDQAGKSSSPVVPNGTWTKSPRPFPLKESPSRGVPDPEHLRAVWSQTPDKAALPSVNSLKGIADDLTAVPFTLQDVKSEDGGTPPPSGPGPSRMSSYDVTRAFQQVPASSAKSPPRNTTLPPPVGHVPNGSSSRSAFPSYQPTTLRPPYAYPSPVLSHSPSPTVMYPQSPVPRPMMVNGPPSPYAQPMWMPMGGAPQPQANMMRPMASPFTPQFVPYPSPGPVPVYIPSPNMSNPQQPPNGAQGRGPMMSPMMQPHALYSSSPVLMHSPAGLHVQPPHGYAATPSNRGQVRGNFEHAPGGSSIPAPMGHPPQQPPYPTTPAYSVRPAW